MNKLEVTEKIIQRFKSKYIVDPKTGCWLWTSAIDKDGYGIFCLNKSVKNVKAHRFSWIIHNGEIPKGLFCCHTCDRPGCCNPEHVFLGTAKDNSKDREQKARHSHPKHFSTGFCKRGHEITDVNLSFRKRNNKIERICRLCSNMRRVERYHLKKNEKRT